MMSGKMNTNMYCTREMAACNFQPKYLRGSERSNAAIACNEAVGGYLDHPSAVLLISL